MSTRNVICSYVYADKFIDISRKRQFSYLRCIYLARFPGTPSNFCPNFLIQTGQVPAEEFNHEQGA